jgi:hypothetical protein
MPVNNGGKRWRMTCPLPMVILVIYVERSKITRKMRSNGVFERASHRLQFCEKILRRICSYCHCIFNILCWSDLSN